MKLKFFNLYRIIIFFTLDVSVTLFSLFHSLFLYYSGIPVMVNVVVNSITETCWNYCSLRWSLVHNFLSFLVYFGFTTFFFQCCFSYGVWLIFNWCSMFPKSTHKTITAKIFQSFRAHPRLEKAKVSETDFTLYHYAGKACCTIFSDCKLKALSRNRLLGQTLFVICTLHSFLFRWPIKQIHS